MRVYLPRQAFVAAPEAPEEEPVASGSGEVVLLVDDEEALVRLGEEMLAQLGYEPVGYASSTAALAAFREDPMRFDLVLSDEAMPAARETECCRRSCCRGHRPQRRYFAQSWHLSVDQQAEIDDFWRDPRNQCTLRAFLRFVNCGNASAKCGAADSVVRDPCGQPVEWMRPLEDAAARQ